MDLAYIFLKTASKAEGAPADVYSNVAKLVGCPAVQVSDTIEVK